MTAKRVINFICACSMAMLLWPSDALAQRGGGHGGGGGSPAVSRGGGPAPSGNHGGGYPSGGPGYPSGGRYYGGGYYRPAYYRPYYYRPYFYSPYFYSPFYTSFYFGVGYGYPYFGFGWGYPYYGYYGNPYFSAAYGYPYGPYPSAYPYPAYGYYGWSSARIEVKPREAQVYIDGNYVGIVDQFDGVFQRLDVPPGEHDLTLYMPGYHSYTERTLFRPGEGYHYKTDLQPLPPGTPDDPKPQPQRRTNGNGPDQYQQPGYGPYPNQPGYGPDPNQPGYGRNPNQPGYGNDPYGQPPPPPREPAPYGRTQPPPDRGGETGMATGGLATLSLRVQPADAIVQIDGERWDSPEGGSRVIVQLAPGQHHIEVRKDGFRPYSTTITIRPGEPQSLNISLPQQEMTMRGTRP